MLGTNNYGEDNWCDTGNGKGKNTLEKRSYLGYATCEVLGRFYG
jgi:hypothetical protein